MSWIDDVMDLLCRIYKDLGGDCKDLYASPGKAPKIVVEQYQTVGAPTFSNPADLATFLSNLTALEDALASDLNTLPQTDTDALLDMIASLRKDLGVG
jgi:hypothetical protein